MRYTRSISAECEADCGSTFDIVDGADFVVAGGGTSVAGKLGGVVSVNALALTALVRGGWVAFSHRNADDSFDEVTAGAVMHPGRLNRMLLVCPVCAPEFVPPLSDSAKRQLEQENDRDRAVREAVARLEAELAALKAQVAS